MSDTGGLRRTLAEIGATCLKAARGSGCPWGLAEEAGMAARILAAHGLPGAEALAALLGAPRACACTGRDEAPACAIAALASLSDRAGEIAGSREIALGPVAAPLLLAGPLLLAARRLDTAFALSWPGAEILCTPQGVIAPAPAGGWPKYVERLQVRRADPVDGATPPDWHSRPVAADCWASLEARAARTLVPESAASRARGAGPAAADSD